eukprot:4947753-Pleurochrysis_carterae.AAC.1
MLHAVAMYGRQLVMCRRGGTCILAACGTLSTAACPASTSVHMPSVYRCSNAAGQPCMPS